MKNLSHIQAWGNRTFRLAALLGCLSVTALRAQPNAVNDYVVATGTAAVTFSPLVNDSDDDDLALSIASVSQPSLGNVTWDDSSITYTPNLSFKSFAGADKFTYTITDGIDTATAEIIVGNPFYLQKGNFAGTLANPDGGYVTLTSNANGSFSGKLRDGTTGAAYSFRGAFATDGTWSGTVGGLALALQFDVTNITGSQFGEYSITGTYDSVAFTLWHALYNSTSNPAPQTGKYTVLLPAASGANPLVPAGTGYMTLSVNESGNVSITGNLADGMTFSDGVYITGGSDAFSNNFPIYALLGYATRGSLTGTVTFEDVPGVSDCDGSVTWVKPAQSNNPSLYPAGFNTTVSAVGSRYSQPPFGTLALGLTGSDPNANILLTEPDFAASLYHELYITQGLNTSTDTVHVFNPGADGLTLSINAGSGTFTGTFIHPLTGKPVNIKGALLHKQTRAAGYFLGPTQSGNASIWP